MLKILDRYILKGFFPILAMTFLISWFIVLMQFLWKYVDELVGKGLSVWIITQTIFYAAMSLVPLALSLGILFASLMYFGNIGERLELLAMKASGVPLYRIMRPLFVSVLFLAGGLFVFQNTFLITSQVRMWTIILSARKASLELEIPEGTFYNGIPGYSIYVRERDKQNAGRLLDIMLYDYKEGLNSARIIRADSGRIVMDATQTYLSWRLYNGQSFQGLAEPNGYQDPRPTAYAKERFGYKEILIAFDANFKQADESEMRGRFVGKNLASLSVAIDTTTHTIDSIRSQTASQLMELVNQERYSYEMPRASDTTEWARGRRRDLLGGEESAPSAELIASAAHYQPDRLLVGKSLSDSISLISRARNKLISLRSEAELKLYLDKDAYYEYRTNRQEWHRKFTFPAACIVFFFIGAPMGAIIRKGGLGMPVVISVLFFIIYYIIDTFGHNMILSQKMGVVMGMWISTLVLLPIGLLLAYQANRDSATLNFEAYGLFLRRLFGLDKIRKIELQSVSFKDVDYAQALDTCRELRDSTESLINAPLFSSIWTLGWAKDIASLSQLSELSHRLDELVQSLVSTRDAMVLARLKDLPILSREFSLLVPRKALLLAKPLLIIYGTILFPIGLLLLLRRRGIKRDLEIIKKQLGELELQLQNIKA